MPRSRERAADGDRRTVADAMTQNQVKRLFIAVELPEEVRVGLGKLAEHLPGIKWNPTEQLHLTLRFIGDAGPETQSKLGAALRAVIGHPFTLGIADLGVFPSPTRPRVLWAGVEAGQAELISLQETIEYELLEAGLDPQDKPFHPHVTLGRNRNAPAEAVRSWLERHKGLALQPFQVTSFSLFSSKLTPQGAVHQKEVDYPLGK